MRVAAIDCGTNSLRLLIADIDSDGRLHSVDRRMQIVRLGEGVDATGRFSDAALQRTFAVCDEYAAIIKTHDVERVRFVATSASRDVSNRAEFEAGVQARFGVLPDVISGDEEATLSFLGATSALPLDVEGPYLVIDIGGGSTEFVYGTSTAEFAKSVDIGCVRLTERHLHGDPADQTDIDKAIHDIDTAIDEAAQVVPLDRAKNVIGLAGSVTTVAAMVLGLEKYDRSAIDGALLSKEQVHRAAQRLLDITRAQRAALPYIHPGRVDVIGAGALVLDRIMRRLPNEQMYVSESDILDGIARRLSL